MPDLRVVPLEGIRRHEEIDPLRVERLMGRIGADSTQVNPMMCAEASTGELVLLDGATRTEALKKLGLEHAVVQMVQRSHAKLETWHHVIRGCPSADVVTQIEATAGLELTEAGPTPRIHAVEGSYSSVVGNALSINATLSTLVDTYIGTRKVSRIIDPSTEQVGWSFPDWSVVVEFPTLTIEDVVSAAVGQDLLPAGITRFLIDDRALRLNMDLDLLRSDLSREDKQQVLDELLEQRAHEGRIRRYEEPVYILDD